MLGSVPGRCVGDVGAAAAGREGARGGCGQTHAGGLPWPRALAEGRQQRGCPTRLSPGPEVGQTLGHLGRCGSLGLGEAASVGVSALPCALPLLLPSARASSGSPSHLVLGLPAPTRPHLPPPSHCHAGLGHPSDLGRLWPAAYTGAAPSREALPRSGARRPWPAGWADSCDVRGLSRRVNASPLLCHVPHSAACGGGSANSGGTSCPGLACWEGRGGAPWGTSWKRRLGSDG